MNILVASNAHRDFASSIQVGNWIKAGILDSQPDWQVQVISVGDGGEGTVESMILTNNGQYRYFEALNPLYDPITASAGFSFSTSTAFLEIAETAGAKKLDGKDWNTLYTTSFGTGTLIREVSQTNVQHIIIALGGSIISDGGLGMAQALGVQFFDSNNQVVIPENEQHLTCRDLIRIDRADIIGVPSFIMDKQYTILSDVDIPLLGPFGQARSFGAQKKASKQDIEFIEYALTNWNRVLGKSFNKDFDIPLAGAAGGLGAGLMAFLGGDLRLGIDYVLDFINFDSICHDYDLVVTGEGRLDKTTSLGKCCQGIAKRCETLGKSYYGIFGYVEEMISKFNGKTIDASLIGRSSEKERLLFSKKAIFEAGKALYGEIDANKQQ